ncbi:MAG TPA: cysteine desulfurase [Flavobacterium sp.]
METKDKKEKTSSKNEFGLDIQKIRKDFPMLKNKRNGKKIIYFDSAATNQKPQVVIDRLNMLYTQEYGKPQENHELSKVMTQAMDETREKVAKFIKAKESRSIVFTSGCTESLNIVAQGFAREILKKDDEILITELEHHANIIPWQMASELTGAVIVVAPVNRDGEVDIELFNTYITDNTKIISISHTSHVLGTVLPVEEIIKIAHSRDIPVLVDAAQSAPHMPINVREMDCDFLTFSAHKMGGPAGVGVLYGKTKWLKKLPPHFGGSENSKEVTFEKTKYKPIPEKFEAGTPAFEEIVAFGSLIDYVNELDMVKSSEYEIDLLKYATERLQTLPKVELYGLSSNKEPVISFSIKGADAKKLEEYLSSEHNICVRSGTLSAQPLLKKLGVKGLIRASFCYYNTRKEIDKFLEAIESYIER